MPSTDIWQALSHPARRRVLTLLRNGVLTAGEIGAVFPFSAATLSGHLRTLREANLVSCTPEGTRRLYRLNLSVAEDALTGLLDLLRVGEADRSITQGDSP